MFTSHSVSGVQYVAVCSTVDLLRAVTLLCKQSLCLKAEVIQQDNIQLVEITCIRKHAGAIRISDEMKNLVWRNVEGVVRKRYAITS